MDHPQPDNASIPPPGDTGDDPLRFVDAISAAVVITVAAVGVAVAFSFAIAGVYAGEKLHSIRRCLGKKGGRDVS
jgi:hypothetical protein